MGESWDLFTFDDIMAFLGFSILMGINRLPSVEDYWKRKSPLYFSPIATRISRDRYRELFRFLHFVNNSGLSARGTDGYDKLGKIRPLITYLSERFQSVYRPHREVAVDEAMVKFQGRSSLKQYLPMKPIKRGFKVWVLADSINGYCSRFILVEKETRLRRG